jgi:hypothetical protein
VKILKYPLAHMGRQMLRLPADAQIVAVQGQFDLCTIWVRTSTTDLFYDHTFVCAFTGDELPDGLKYLGTCQFHGGATVVHVFEEAVP